MQLFQHYAGQLPSGCDSLPVSRLLDIFQEASYPTTQMWAAIGELEVAGVCRTLQVWKVALPILVSSGKPGGVHFLLTLKTHEEDVRMLELRLELHTEAMGLPWERRLQSGV